MADRRANAGRRLEDVRASWHRYDWGKYKRKTSHLRMLEHGAYTLLQAEYYDTQAPLVANVEQLLFICRATSEAEKQAVQQVLAEFFVLEDDGFHHPRIDEEIARANQLIEKRRDAGHKGGEANASRLLKREEKTREEKTNTESKAKATPPNGDVPEWIPRQDWQAFVEMRKKIRAPLTSAAQTIAINTLAKLKAQGHNPAEILQQSVMHSWRGLFEPRSNGNGQPRQSAFDRVAAEVGQAD